MQGEPLLNVFVQLASSENQYPTPPLPVAAYYLQQVKRAAQDVMFREGTAKPQAVLHDVAERVRVRLKEVLSEK